MLRNFKFNKITTFILGCILLSGVASCFCEPSLESGAEKAKMTINMKVKPASIGGDQKEIQVTFKWKEKLLPAVLADYALKVELIAQGNKPLGKAEINYIDGANVASSISEFGTKQSLTHFIPQAALQGDKDEYTLTFTVKSMAAPKAIIRFELLDKEGTGGNLKEVQWIHEKKPIDLVLERVGADKPLKGDRGSFKLRIINHGSEQTEERQMKLKITRDKGASATIQGAMGMEGSNDSIILLSELIEGEDSIEKELQLSMGNDLEAAFKFQLTYMGEPHGEAVTITVSAGKLSLSQVPIRLVGDHVASFMLLNEEDEARDMTHLSLELVSEGGVTFQFVKDGKPIGESQVELRNLLFKNVEEGLLKPRHAYAVYFRVNNSNNSDLSQLVVRLKKGNHEVAASEKIIWEAKGRQLELVEKKNFGAEYLLSNFDSGELSFKNVGNEPINLDEVGVSLTNQANLLFNIGHVQGAHIQVNLSEVIGSNALLQVGETCTFGLQLVAAAKLEQMNAYGNSVTLTVRDKNNTWELVNKFGWVNQEKIFKLLDPKVSKDSEKIADFYEELEKLLGDSNIAGQDARLRDFCNITLKKSRLRAKAADVELAVKNIFISVGQHDAAIRFIKELFDNSIGVFSDTSAEKIGQLVAEDVKIINGQVTTLFEQASKTKDATILDECLATFEQLVEVINQLATENGTHHAKLLYTKVKKYQEQIKALRGGNN